MSTQPAGALAAIGLGANLGDRAARLDAALQALRGLPGLALRAASSYHETEPVGGPAGQPRFLNGAALLEARIPALELLRALQRLERAAGRDRRNEVRNGPRPLDLDLLLFASLRVQSRRLELPHPRLEERLFVLEPLAEIAPELVLPGCGRTVAQRAAELRASAVAAESVR